MHNDTTGPWSAPKTNLYNFVLSFIKICCLFWFPSIKQTKPNFLRGSAWMTLRSSSTMSELHSTDASLTISNTHSQTESTLRHMWEKQENKWNNKHHMLFVYWRSEQMLDSPSQLPQIHLHSAQMWRQKPRWSLLRFLEFGRNTKQHSKPSLESFVHFDNSVVSSRKQHLFFAITGPFIPSMFCFFEVFQVPVKRDVILLFFFFIYQWQDECVISHSHIRKIQIFPALLHQIAWKHEYSFTQIEDMLHPVTETWPVLLFLFLFPGLESKGYEEEKQQASLCFTERGVHSSLSLLFLTQGVGWPSGPRPAVIKRCVTIGAAHLKIITGSWGGNQCAECRSLAAEAISVSHWCCFITACAVVRTEQSLPSGSDWLQVETVATAADTKVISLSSSPHVFSPTARADLSRKSKED